ncbi:unnamed protein product [Rotaria magnacalcarata]|uniref:Uncharacterized protein n=1 Tax=Rotaria magnacalcarata TaxID=392030 RepID=A0A815UXQ3_9BILA|nr:unnamed protein product [Rotaria magnacalcarata]CAF1634485.1 unnamed protein product [Rotaria magnacalcarata]
MVSMKCRICGDVARGLNFNVMTCMSCKSFFRRNAKKKMLLSLCQFDNDCDITIRTRGNCSPCRLKKCLGLGMDPELNRCNSDSNSSTSKKIKKIPTIDDKRIELPPTCSLDELSSLPPKLRSKSPKIMYLARELYASVEPLMKRSSDITSLTITSRQVFLKHNLPVIAVINGFFLCHELNIFDNTTVLNISTEKYEPDFITEVRRNVDQYDPNGSLTKILPLPLSLLQNDRSTLTTNEWTLLSNILHAFDEENALTRIQCSLDALSALPPKLRSKPIELMKFVRQLYLGVGPLIVRSLYFHSLLTNDRQLLKHNLYMIGMMNELFLSRELGLIGNASIVNRLAQLYEPKYMIEMCRNIARYDHNGSLIKILLFVIGFSCNCSIVKYNDATQHRKKHDLNKDLFVKIKIPNVPRPSFIWNYFGHLYKQPSEPLDIERIYCKICFDKIKEEYPDSSFYSKRKKIGVYGATSGTGNMKNHLLAVHQLTEVNETRRTSNHILSMFSRDRNSTKSSQLKEQLGHQLTLMCCKDLLPFSIVDNEGFQDFLIANKVVSTKTEIPSRSILSPVNLNKIYNVCVEKTKEQMKLSTNYPTITCDAWCDKYSLKTQPFDEAHTGEAIKDLISGVLTEFGINVNNVIVVSDKGANMRKAWRLLNIIHIFCVAHGIHNLLMKDCFPRMHYVSELFDKVQVIINKLRYRQHELENEHFQLDTKKYTDLFSSINKAGEILDADLASTNLDADDSEVLNEKCQNNNLEELWLSNDLKMRSKTSENTYKFNCSALINNHNDSNRFHTLKKRVLTRWNTILIMLRSYADNIAGIEVILGRLKHFDLILSVNENQIVRDLIDFLSLFESTTTILSASKSYPTISLCLLLRIEIESLLRIDGMESSVIEELKCLLSENLDNRFPVSHLNICAFLLDPSQLKIDISRYLVQCQTNKESILCEMVKKFRINHVTQESAANNVSTLSPSCTLITTATSDSSSSTTTSSASVKRILSVESLNPPVQNLKKLKENLIQKHKPTPSSAIDHTLNEIQNYLQLDIHCGDVLQFWQSSGDAYPHLKRLAQIILAIPATSTPSEQVFSTTGLILNAKRTMLLPENVGKIQMIHDNYNLLKNT